MIVKGIGYIRDTGTMFLLLQNDFVVVMYDHAGTVNIISAIGLSWMYIGIIRKL